jgi:hypothetical protein
VIYTPGDNEWTDTHDERVGSHDPLERLASIRRIFFCNQSLSVNGEAIDVVCQSSCASKGNLPQRHRTTEFFD